MKYLRYGFGEKSYLILSFVIRMVKFSMVSNEFVDRIKEILQDGNKGIKYLTNQLKMSECNDEEQRLLYILIQINESLLPFKYKISPYSYLTKVVQDLDRSYIKCFADLSCERSFKVKMYDFLWTCFKDYNSSQHAYNMYIELVRAGRVSFEESFSYLIRAFSITAATGNKFERVQEIKGLAGIFINNNLEDTTARTFNLLEMFYEEKTGDNDFFIEIINKKIELLNKKSNVYIMEAYLNLLEKLYARKKNINLKGVTNDKDIIRVRRLKVDYYLSQAKKLKENPHIVVENYKKAVRVLKALPDTKGERILILKDMEIYQKKILNSMYKTESKKDISKEVRQIIEPIKDKDILFSIRYFTITIPIIVEENLKQKMIQNAQKFSFSALFSRSLLDKKGKLKYVLPPILNNSNENDIMANTYDEFKKSASIHSQVLVVPVLNYLTQNFNINEEIIEKIVDHNAFIDEKRKNAFTKGILAGFQYDFITALSILIPQVENSIRCLAELCGDVVYDNNEEGIEQLKTLNAVIELPCLNEVLESDLIFNMKGVFTSKYGLNIRNDIAHGNLDDGEFHSAYAVYAWYFILKLCCMNSRWILFGDN